MKRVRASRGRSPLTRAHQNALFARRAEALAARAPSPPPRDTFETLVFAVGGEVYAFPSAQVEEVRPLVGLTPLPGTPAFLAGLINVRGRLVPVLDVRPLLGIATSAGPAPTAVLVGYRGGQVGVLATDRPSIRVLRLTDLTAPPADALPGLDPACVRGMAPGPLVVLDAERLLDDPRLVVQHDFPSMA